MYMLSFLFLYKCILILMRPITEYLSNKIKKSYYTNYIKATNDTIHKIVKDELDRFGHDADLNHIDVSNVTDMSFVFCARALNTKCLGFEYDDINPNISKWDVSNVVNMEHMFFFCERFNCDISEWDVSKVENMYAMFYRCKKFYQDLHDWNAENVKSYSYMFSDRMVKKKKYWPKAFPWE